MTTNMRNAIEQAAYEVGRATAKYEMLLGASTATEIDPGYASASAGPRKRPGRVAKATTKTNFNIVDAPTEQKAPTIARGVRKSTGPRTKGVKEAVLNLISEEPEGIKTGDIVARLGFKPTSVNATLMGLKKSGLVTQANKLWFAGSPNAMNVNGDDTEASIGSEY